MTEISDKRGRGRPAAFDYDTALESAMRTFWLYGFEGTSMTELTKAMSMNKTSIYAAYGSKEALFQKAVNRYASGPVRFVAEALNEKSAFEVVKKLLTTAAVSLTNVENPSGCMIIQGALSCSKESRHIHDMLSAYRHSYEKRLVDRLDRAKEEMDIPADADTKVLAKLVVTVHQGMSVQASSGATKEELLSIANIVAEKFKQ
jgi:AcrR family transcriptional regulator